MRDTAERTRRGAQWHTTIRPARGHDTANWAALKGERRALEGLTAGGVCRDAINCIVTGRRLGRWVVSRHRRYTAGGSTTIWRRELRYSQQCAQGRDDTAPRHSARYGRVCTTTRSGQACDTAGQGLRHGRAQCGRRLGQGVHLTQF